LDLGDIAQQLAGIFRHHLTLDTALVKNRADDAFAFFGQGNQQVQRVNLLMSMFGRNRLRSLRSFLGLLGEFVEANHDVVLGLKMNQGGGRLQHRSAAES
jgi:hypothetical protein